MGERSKDALIGSPDESGLKLEFNVTKVTRDARKRLKLAAIRGRF